MQIKIQSYNNEKGSSQIKQSPYLCCKSIYFVYFCAQSCPTLCNPLGSSIHGIFQARILEWFAIFFSGGPSWPRNQTPIFYVSRNASRLFITTPPVKPYHILMKGSQLKHIIVECFTPDSLFYLRNVLSKREIVLNSIESLLQKLACTYTYSIHVCSVAQSCSLQPYGLQPVRLLHPWNFPGKNNGGFLFPRQGIFLTQGSNPCLLCLLHRQVDSLPLHHLGSLKIMISPFTKMILT